MQIVVLGLQVGGGRFGTSNAGVRSGDNLGDKTWLSMFCKLALTGLRWTMLTKGSDQVTRHQQGSEQVPTSERVLTRLEQALRQATSF